MAEKKATARRDKSPLDSPSGKAPFSRLNYRPVRANPIYKAPPSLPGRGLAVGHCRGLTELTAVH